MQLTMLAAIIDQTSVSQLLSAIAGICDEKADHIRSSYQDEKLAKRWEHKRQLINNVAEKV
jgi:hypothetical protein